MIFLISCIILIAVDQFTKLAVLGSLKSVGSIGIIDGFFSLTYVENRGAAFGMLEGGKWIFIAITLAVVVFAAVYYIKMPKTKENLWLRIAMAMIISGAIGNAVDRLFRGYVVDFLDFIIFGYDFPVFNFADILVVLGTALLAGGIIIFDGKEKT